ncbi:aminotransferase class I/II-fold pyridoxal phosphate-dependent enzyme [Alicyclobacillus ferrooxydans]|nr:methionine gamma-lyase family protein [Alicyclobacillus ferrooxydans]
MTEERQTRQVNVQDLMREAEERLRTRFRQIDAIALRNQKKVLEAFWAERVSAPDLSGSTGYGLDDAGRDKLERVYANAFGAEAALVRPQIVSGTHALRLGLFGVLRPLDEIVFATGKPYDTLEGVVGIRPMSGSLAEWGISHKLIPLLGDGTIDMPAVLEAIGPRTKVVFFQRSRGYADRPALSISSLHQSFRAVREAAKDVFILVDNCYGEFVEDLEPSAVGADLVMGSLIKNPGAGIMTTGGYIAGTKTAVEHAAEQLTAPGVGGEYGPTHDFLRPLFQSLFLAPHVVAQAVKGSLLAAYVFEALGLNVSPRWEEGRSDLILAITFGDPERLLAFCRAVQSTAPIDSFVRPEADAMAGYDDEVVMAAGTFVQGGSLEMSADAPMRAPFIGYLQGGLTYEHVYIAVERIASDIMSLM